MRRHHGHSACWKVLGWLVLCAGPSAAVAAGEAHPTATAEGRDAAVGMAVGDVAPSHMPLNMVVEEPIDVQFDAPQIVGETDFPATVLDAPVWEPIVTDEYPLEVPLDLECGATGSPWLRNLSVAAGVHGFKGPSDLGRSGNFGLDEGVNWGAAVPLVQSLPLLSGLGFQIGARGVHSNFSGGHEIAAFGDFGSDRDQFFFTAATFRRAEVRGWQTGGAFDYFYDNYYDKIHLKQARTEVAYVWGGRHEVGFWGAYGAGSDQVTFTILQKLIAPLEPNDVYTLFYRRRFTGGGVGRLWGGATGDGDIVLGGDATVPLGTNWSLQNNITYLSPKDDRGFGRDTQESWAVSIRLVWYPGQPSRCAYRDRFHPLFDVADNGVFLIERGAASPVP